MLKWNPAELTEFFGVVPVFKEETIAHSFELSRDGLRLLVTIFDFEGRVWVSLIRDGLPAPLVTLRCPSCTHAQLSESAHFRRCFEAGTTQHPVTDMGIPPVIVRGVRVYVEPQFQIELIAPPGE